MIEWLHDCMGDIVTKCGMLNFQYSIFNGQLKRHLWSMDAWMNG